MISKRGTKQMAKWTAAALGGLAIAGVIAPREAAAQTQTNVRISGPGGTSLLARVYAPASPTSGMPGEVMLHGCSGMWSSGNVPTQTCVGSTCTVEQGKPAQSHIEKWGRQLASHGYWAIAVDSYSNRGAGTQNQCGAAQVVNPYTTRPGDFYAAKDYLIADRDAAEAGIGVIGWSQGAETALIVSAETPMNQDTTYCSMGVAECAARMADRPAAAVIFYPGCRSDLNFGFVKGTTGTWDNPQDPGYFRPDIAMRWNHGLADTTVPFGACGARIDEAIGTYQSDIELDTYANVGHSFDINPGTTNAERWAFPTVKCTAAEQAIAANAEMCARRDADIDSWAFIQANVTGE